MPVFYLALQTTRAEEPTLRLLSAFLLLQWIFMFSPQINLILLLEDEPFIALDVEEMLTDPGVRRVITFSTCAGASAWIDANTPDLAIVDPNLKDGFSAAIVRTLVARDVPFVVYSGDAASASEREPAFHRGNWLAKPCLPDALIAAIDVCLSERRGVPGG